MKKVRANHYTETVIYAIDCVLKNVKIRLNQYITALNPNITAEQFAVLDTISARRRLCQQDIADILFKNKSNVKRIVGILEKRGFVTITAGKKNNRLVNYLEITPAGQKILDNDIAPIKEYMENMFAEVTDAELATLRGIIAKTENKIRRK